MEVQNSLEIRDGILWIYGVEFCRNAQGNSMEVQNGISLHIIPQNFSTVTKLLHMCCIQKSILLKEFILVYLSDRLPGVLLADRGIESSCYIQWIYIHMAFALRIWNIFIFSLNMYKKNLIRTQHEFLEKYKKHFPNLIYISYVSDFLLV